jgi:hypothetical protein
LQQKSADHQYSPSGPEAGQNHEELPRNFHFSCNGVYQDSECELSDVKFSDVRKVNRGATVFSCDQFYPCLPMHQVFVCRTQADSLLDRHFAQHE